jgi:hypothetical protein
MPQHEPRSEFKTSVYKNKDGRFMLAFKGQTREGNPPVYASPVIRVIKRVGIEIREWRNTSLTQEEVEALSIEQRRAKVKELVESGIFEPLPSATA